MLYLDIQAEEQKNTLDLEDLRMVQTKTERL